MLPAETVAYWRFEGATSQPPTAGVAIAHTSGRSALPGTSELLVEDASGNGNTLFGWDGAEGSLRYAAAPAALDALASGQPNAFAVESGGDRPRAFTWSRQSAPSGLDLDSFQPLAWTIEASIYLDPAGSDGWRTFLGRDGHGVAQADANLACLYFQKTAGGVLRLQFVDAAGNVWEAADSAPLLAGRWYHVAAVSDGEELRLYKWDTTADWTYQLVATTDLASSADPRLAADTMDASSAPRDTAGDPFNWTIGSGMFASGGSPTSGHADFWVGAIDEVRISDHARRPGELLFAPRIVPTPGLAPDEPHRGHLELAWDSQAGAHYRVESAPAPAADWSPRATGVAATPPRNQWTEKEPAGPARFYRVLPDRAPVVLELDPTTVLNHVDEAIYGHFLEHIYRSVNGGLWGELVWNRSFELWPAALGAWELEDDILVQTSGAAGVELTFGDPAWTDYEFTLQARKDSGAEGFLILLRDAGGGRYWLNLGGWGNTRHQFEKGAGNPVGPSVAGSIATGRWYDLRVRAEGSRLRAWLDGGLLLDWTDPDGALLTGGVGIGTWATQARFRQFEVRSLGGASLFSGLPTVNDAYVPTEWEPFGPATPSRHGDAANSHFATLLRKTGSGESGLRQTPIPLTPQRYEGSLWAKGSGGGEIVVRLKEGDEVLAEAALGSPTDEWVAYPFTLTPSRAALDGTLEVAFAGDDD
ncbi:MAG: LamG-like jellyroll fold domain-containing protein, partial [Verrucomicrobiota bacterium]